MTTLKYLNNVITHDDTIHKSIHDTRKYSTLKLNNNMRIVWVHDANTNKSAASMTVGVGHFSDGKIKGIAHFLEHMLFMGSHKYIDFDFYNNKLAEFGGSSNAYTSHDHTNYYFDVANTHFFEMLEIFSRFFIDPLLNELYVEKEKNAVDSEHNKNILSDEWRQQDILRKMAKNKSPYSTFSTGNLETFDVPNLYSYLKLFYDKYYSSDIMTLVIVSDKDLNDISDNNNTWKEQLVNMFSQVPNKNVLNMIKNEYDFTEILEKNNNYIEMVPIKDDDIIRLIWEIPFNYNERHIYEFISHVIGHEGDNTFISILKQKLFVTNVSVFFHEPVGKKMLFEIKIKVSPNGKNNTMYIINLALFYIDLFYRKSKENNNHILDLYNEYAKITINNFIHQDKQEAEDYAALLSAESNYIVNMQNDDIKNILTHSILFQNETTTSLCGKLINILKMLNILNINIVASSYSFKNCTTDIEKYYGTQYTHTTDIYISMLSKIDKSFSVPDDKNLNTHNCFSTKIKKNINSISKEIIQLPKINKFISTNFSINVDDFSNKYPSIININGLTLYYKQHSEQRKYMPQTVVVCSINTDWLDLTTEEGVRNNIILSVYVSCLKKSISEFLYMCDVASYRVSFSLAGSKINLSVIGFNDKINFVAEKLVDKFLNPVFTTHLVESIIHTYKRNIHNEIFMEPYKNVFELLNSHIYPLYKTREERLKIISTISYDEIISVPEIITNDVQTKINVVVMGNSTIEDAKKITTLFTPFVSDSKQKINKKIKLNDDTHLFHIYDACNSSENNSAMVHQYKISNITYDVNELTNNKNNWLYLMCVVNIFDSIIKTKFFDQVRSVEQLGYITRSFPKIFEYGDYKLLSYGFLVQSSHASALHLYDRTTAFIYGDTAADFDNVGCHNILQNMTTEEYDTVINSLCDPLKKDHESFFDEITFTLSVIKNNHNMFDMRERQYDMLKKIKKEDVIDFFLQYFNKDMSWTIGINKN